MIDNLQLYIWTMIGSDKLIPQTSGVAGRGSVHYCLYTTKVQRTGGKDSVRIKGA